MTDKKSKNAINFVDEVEQFSKSRLNKKAELLRIYEEAMNAGKEELLEEVTFTAKYIRGLMRVLQNGVKNPEVKSLNHIKRDFTSNMEKIVDQFKEILSGADDQLKNHFEENYFVISQEGLMNLNELLSDLEWTKIYLNEQKRKNKN